MVDIWTGRYRRGRGGASETIQGRQATTPPTAATLAFELPEIPEWMERGLCAQTDPDAFFPDKGGSTRDAKKICQTCEVRSECLEYAVGNDERFGIWGGLSERERRKLKKERAA